MIKYLLPILLLLGGCASTPQEPQVVVDKSIVLYHPQLPDSPHNPGLKVRVITKERITAGKLPDVAYVGFTYDEWLEFAKWMNQYKGYSKELLSVIEQYAEQDTRDDRTDNPDDIQTRQ